MTKTSSDSTPRSMVMTRIGGVEYPMRSQGNCHTCQDPFRAEIENEILAGRTYRAIADMLAERPAGRLPHPDHIAIARHVTGNHLPLPVMVQRRLIERRAQSIGKALDDATEQLVDYHTVNEMIVHKGWERMQAGEINPNMSELLTAIRSLHSIESTLEGGMDQETWVSALTSVIEVVREHVDGPTWQAIGGALAAHPVLRSLAHKQDALTEAEVA